MAILRVVIHSGRREAVWIITGAYALSVVTPAVRGAISSDTIAKMGFKRLRNR